MKFAASHFLAAIAAIIGSGKNVVVGECTLGTMTIESGEMTPIELTFPNSAPPGIKIFNDGPVKFTVFLEGESCATPLQSNIVLSRRDREHFAYLPLLCPDSSINDEDGKSKSKGKRKCHVGMNAEEALLQAAKYEAKLFMALPNPSSTKVTTFEWNLGVMDFEEAKVINKVWGSADQQEDIFTKIEPEISLSYVSRDLLVNWSMIVLLSLLFVLPWIILAWWWMGHETSLWPERKAWNWPRISLMGLMGAWMALAMITWLFLDVLQTLLGATILAIPTYISAYYTFLVPTKIASKED